MTMKAFTKLVLVLMNFWCIKDGKSFASPLGVVAAGWDGTGRVRHGWTWLRAKQWDPFCMNQQLTSHKGIR